MKNEKTVLDMDKYLKFTLLDDDTYAVISFKHDMIEEDKIESLVIPSTYNGKPVTAIGDSAFAGSKTSVDNFIDYNRTLEGYDEYRIKDVTGAYIYDRDTFSYFRRDKKPINGIACINNVCVGSVEDGTVYIKTLGESVKRRDAAGRKYETIVCGSVKSIVIPDSVTIIGDSAFCGCRGITNITIGNRVEHIGLNAFMFCNKITDVIIPDSVTYLGIGAFGECKSLENMTFGNGISELKDYMLRDVSKLKSLTLGKSVTKIDKELYSKLVDDNLHLTIDSENPTYKVVNKQLYSKDGKTLLKANCKESIFIIPDDVIEIKANALIGDGLNELVIPASVKHIESSIIPYGDVCRKVYYKGSKESWQNISKEQDYKYDFRKVTLYFYSEKKKLFGKCWHYAADGVTPTTVY